MARLFEVRKSATSPTDSKSLYRNRHYIAPSGTTRLGWLLEAPDPHQPQLDEAVVFSGALSSAAEALFSHHVVGGTIILPGAGYVEMAFAASSARALTAVAFLMPCSLSGPGRGEKCVLRCTRRATGALEIASARCSQTPEASSFAMCFAGTLANIEGSHTETKSGRGLYAQVKHCIKTSFARRNAVVPQATFGPRPRLLKLASRIGSTAWTFSARKSTCSSSRQLSRSANPANIASNNSKCTHLHSGRWQSCKSLCGTMLSTSHFHVSRTSVDKYIYSGETSSLRAAQVQASSTSFRGLLLVTVSQSKPLSAGSVPQPTSSRPQGNLKLKEPAAAKAGARSQTALLDELTTIASEVIGTRVAADAPLMSAGLDSIGATELATQMSDHLNMELPSTLLFDHPSLRSIADSLSLDRETEEVLKPDFETVAEESRGSMQQPQRAKAQSTPAIVETISSALSDILGTTVADRKSVV